MKRKSSKRGKSPRRPRTPRGALVPPVVGTMLDIIEEITFAFGTGAAAAESDTAPTLKKLNRYDQL